MVTTMPLGSTTLCDATPCDGDHLAVIRPIATLRDDAVAGAHAPCDHLPFGPLQLFETMQSHELTPNVITFSSAHCNSSRRR